MSHVPARGCFALFAFVLPSFVAGCGGGSALPDYVPFVSGSPDTPGGGGIPPIDVPPPTFPKTPVFAEDAFGLGRTAMFGSFPSDLVRFGSTLFTSDADAIEASGARIVPIDVSGPSPLPSAAFASTTMFASTLVDSAGNPGDVNAPIGFGFFVNDLLVVSGGLGFALVNAGGSDSSPTLSNLVVFNPTLGSIREVIDLANVVPAPSMLDSAGAPVPGGQFVQSQAEGVEFVPLGAGGRGRLFVAMANIVFGPPSFGAVKLPGTVQVFDVDPQRAPAVAPIASPGFATRTLFTQDHNPVAVSRLERDGGDRVLVTVAGTTQFDASFQLVPATPSSVEAFDVATLAPLGRFDLGLVGLSGIRPAIGRDAAGHRVAYFASSVLGEVYLLWLDGLALVTPEVDPARVSVVRGRNNPIPIDPASAGSPGGNVAGLALSSDGRTLLASGFGDFFAFPSPLPGRLYALSLPHDVLADPSFPRQFVAGTTQVFSTSGRSLGPLVLAANGAGPEVYVTVSGPLSPTTFAGIGPASVGTLDTFGVIK